MFLHFLEIQKKNVGSAGSTLFFEFPGNATNNVQKNSFGMGPRKKVPESAGLVGACASLTSDRVAAWLLEAATAADFD